MLLSTESQWHSIPEGTGHGLTPKSSDNFSAYGTPSTPVAREANKGDRIIDLKVK